MKFLTVDVGTGTQDIFLYQSGLAIENGFKLVVPSPTMIVFRKIKKATRQGKPLALTGVTMGGGPSHWAARDHVQAGYPLYATPDAARTFDDDLDLVRESGIDILSEDEVQGLPAEVQRIDLKDFDFSAISRALGEFGISLTDLDGAAVAVFDHGAAPPGYSDRQFRFDYLAERLAPNAGDSEGGKLSRLAFRRGEIPPKMTRLQAVEDCSWDIDAPLMIMDTAPAAVLGASLDSAVQRRPRVMVANVGNFHTLAFRLNENRVEGVFEHHTGLVDPEKLDNLLGAFAAGTLTHEEIFSDHGHGALIYSQKPYPLDEGDFDVVVTGPRRNMMRNSALRPYFAAPFGDMMLTGCFGLLAAASDVFPDLGDKIRGSLFQESASESGSPPWEIS
ncbi:MAG: pyruvate formate lyase-activating protein [Anaerolineales bacterium]|nr:MAG: pyruvate formate lyase-activating protein [Anaerolineales bacterium]